MSVKTSYHMTPDEFRKHGAEALEWVARYQESVASMPVQSQVAPGAIRSQLPSAPPAGGESFDAILKDMDRIILPGITHWQSPNFFAFFPANASGPSILADMISSGLGVQGMLWATSPACTELETQVMDWMAGMLGLPEQFLSTGTGGGVIQDTASSATLCAVLAGRERATAFGSNENGVQSKLVAYTSTQAHSSVEKAVKVAGLGRQNLRLIDVDETYAMRPELLERQIQKDIESGMKPAFVCATVGTTSSNAMDPVRTIGEICKKFDIWFHVDAAMSGNAAMCPEFRHILDGLETADSFCFNPHKWTFVNFDCDCFFVADRASLIKTLSILPEYLKNKATESGAVIDYRDWHIPLGRRFRALKLWFVIRWYGVEGLQFHIRKHVALAQEFAAWVRSSEDFEVVAPAPLNLVCFRHRKGDEVTKKLMERVNASGRMYLTHTTLGGKFTLRMSVGQAQTEREHVENGWMLLREMAAEIVSGK